ncbi:TRAP transporter substrate-binding protein [Verticiella sediminum]|uniref:TRAP transporter substrate-binding protein n=1 Tax=Verticiella sediminum TaxID=1247510 RepID=A0A556AXE6_9BURK|nr:TRAP transporter substrate-binding protein [Verticiella sediminum]TSH97617.1 TRAP transporter substrate-binding protein [Verticiella sediminum]
MKKWIQHVLLAAAAPALMAWSGVGHAEEVRARTFKFAYVQPKDSHMGHGVERFAELVAEKSGGKMKVRGYPGGSLGGDLQTVSALQGGTVELTTLPPGLLVGMDKQFGIFDLPFLFDNAAQADAVLDGPAGQTMMQRLPKGLIGLAYWDHGFRNVSNSRHPIASADDFNGLKLRSLQAPLMIDTFNALGANAIAMSFTELFTAMETRAVDGQDNPIVAFETNNFGEVQKHLSHTRHVYNPLVVLMSERAWDRLNDAERTILRQAAEETRAEQRKVSREMEVQAIERLQRQGVVVTDITPEARAGMRDKVQAVTDKYVRELDPQLVATFKTAIAGAN